MPIARVTGQGGQVEYGRLAVVERTFNRAMGLSAHGRQLYLQFQDGAALVHARPITEGVAAKS